MKTFILILSLVSFSAFANEDSKKTKRDPSSSDYSESYKEQLEGQNQARDTDKIHSQALVREHNKYLRQIDRGARDHE